MAKQYSVTVSSEVANIRPGGKGTRTTGGLEFGRLPRIIKDPGPALLKALQDDPHLRVVAAEEAPAELSTAAAYAPSAKQAAKPSAPPHGKKK